MSGISKRTTRPSSTSQTSGAEDYGWNHLYKYQFTKDIKQNEQTMKEILHNCSDVQYRHIRIGNDMKALLIYVDGLIDSKSLEETVLKPLIVQGLNDDDDDSFANQIVDTLATRQATQTEDVQETVKSILGGQVAIFAKESNKILIADLKEFEKRQVSEPATESVVRGPREGFNENIRTNTGLLRQKLKSPLLKIEPLTLGTLSQTDVAIVYIETLAEPSILDEVRKRVGSIKIDAILDSEYIEDYIQDAPYSPFPTVQNTERPDVVISSLLEGKIAIMVNGSPFALIVPLTFWAALESAEDHYENFIYTTAIRWLRFLLLCISFLLPSLYVASTTFHPQLIPADLLFSIAAAREGVPLPAVIEAILMELMFEAFREAGIRLPKPASSAVGMVGALVIGESAVHAGIISAPTVIVVAFTGIASFAIPRYNLGLAFRFLRFPLLILAGTVGFYGIGFGLIMLLIHVVNLSSFGVPYLSPLAPQVPGNLLDILIRVPRWAANRPRSNTGLDIKRFSEDTKESMEQFEPKID
ncbi:spore germination protein [Paenibacillus sp. 1001270B_150601_E10]|uniref:spore germination protein n=1 Tax=Paenibacillus sp. 1001270B_150601_E10 TaxID=2787079 RepID=UPI0018A06433|nr:spore germination protein [Paenibacillus sp. 1001270B_150601_E10]